MYFNKIFLLCCIVATPLATLACQSRGKFGGTYARLLTKKDLRVGPEYSRQRQQGMWEILQAKKLQRAQVHERDEAAVAQKQPFATLAPMGLPTAPERQHGKSSFRLCSTHPIKTAVLFTLLLMASPALAAVEVRPERPRGKHNDYGAWNHDGGVLHANILDECAKLESFIRQNKPMMDKDRAMATQYADAKCPTNFPEYPKAWCPTQESFTAALREAMRGNGRCDRWYALDDEAEGITDRLIAFINVFNKRSEDFHACLTPYLEAKQLREKAETERRIAETERQNAELARQNAEIMLQNAELAKQYAEIMRQNAEIIRMKTEEQNKEAIRQALAVIKTTYAYMDEHMNGRSYQFNPRYQEAFDFFSKNSERCISAPDEECKRELASVHNIEVLSQSVSDEEFIRELTGTALNEQSTGL